MISTKKESEQTKPEAIISFHLVLQHVLAFGAQNFLEARESVGVTCGLDNRVGDSVRLGHFCISMWHWE